MYPMDFEEFLWAIGDEVTADTIRMLWQNKKAAGNSMHRNIMRLFRLYMLVGGMDRTNRKLQLLGWSHIRRIQRTEHTMAASYISVPRDLTKVKSNGAQAVAESGDANGSFFTPNEKVDFSKSDFRAVKKN